MFSAFAAAEVLMAAINESQSLNSAILVNTIKHGCYPTLYGNITFDVNGQAALDILVVQMQDDLEYAQVYPYADAKAEVIYPMPTWTEKDCDVATNFCAGHGECTSFGVCDCDDQYYGLTDILSCDAYCTGELAYDSLGVQFCKELTSFVIGIEYVICE